MPRFDVTLVGQAGHVPADVRRPGFMLGSSDFPGAAPDSRSPHGSSGSPVLYSAGSPPSPTCHGSAPASPTAGPSTAGERRRPVRYGCAHERSRPAAVLDRPRMGQPRRHVVASGSPTTPRTPSATSCSSRSRRSAPTSRPATRSARSRAPSRCPTSTPRCRDRSSRSTTPSSTHPQLLNEDPYGDGWICTIDVRPTRVDGLLDAAAYRALIEG